MAPKKLRVTTLLLVILVIVSFVTIQADEAGPKGAANLNSTADQSHVHGTNKTLGAKKSLRNFDRNLSLMVSFTCGIAMLIDTVCIMVWGDTSSMPIGFLLTVASAYDLAHTFFRLLETALRIADLMLPPWSFMEAMIAKSNGLTFHGMTITFMYVVIEIYISVSRAENQRGNQLRRVKMVSLVVFIVLTTMALVSASIMATNIKGSFGRNFRIFAMFILRLSPWGIGTVFGVRTYLLVRKSIWSVNAHLFLLGARHTFWAPASRIRPPHS